ncbi:BTB/POZ domain-containing protein 9-like [Paramacrobiotus metropolitanus]|uniref:BTB/POZ domain-containing protein 9-like n=1 Tax=Paramacrobiotus metropolitanus TaxID=2943436 RepID=UPI00244632FD|nr:BTB/POZ domain-containing protein 9-like [Paramacrobiotus metropolitanus]
MSSSQVDDVEIKHTDHLVADFKRQIQRTEFSDLTLVVDGTKIPVHRVILASRSDYFRALLFNGMRETNAEEITLHDTDLQSFKVLLEYIYTGSMNLTRLKVEILAGVLGLANKYGFNQLEADMIFHMKNVLNEKNVCSLYQVAFGFSMNDLTSTCMKFVDRYAKSVLESPDIVNLNALALKQLLLRNSLCAREIDIFNVVKGWAAQNDDPEGIKILLEAIRWELLTDVELVNNVRQSNLLQSDRILDVLASKQLQNTNSSLHCNHRGFLDAGVNVASSAFGASVVRGDMGSTLLDCDATNYDPERGYTRHSIETQDKSVATFIQVKLGMPCIINHIRMLLWDKDQRSYSYYVELSYDGVHWTKIVDYSHFLCRSWQELYFPACTVQHIKVVGTHNTANKMFHLVKLEAMWTENAPEVKNGIIVPKENVVSLAKNAAVIEGVSRTRNALINGSLVYDWDNGYCCHQINSGSIVVQLNQPYYLSSLRLLLWDVDDRFYTYVIQTSQTQREWSLVVDTRDSQRRSWQSHSFAQRVVSFIKLQGITNTANEVFHAVHLEAPDQRTGAETSASQPQDHVDNDAESDGNDMEMSVDERPMALAHHPARLNTHQVRKRWSG